jgi:AraC-like DNA-binding protein
VRKSSPIITDENSRFDYYAHPIRLPTATTSFSTRNLSLSVVGLDEKSKATKPFVCGVKAESTTLYRYFPISRRDKNWGLYVTTAGEARIPPHYPVYPPVGHPKSFAFDWQRGRILDGFALVYIASGKGKFESKFNAFTRVEPGQALLLFPGVWHRYMPDPETGWHEYWIGFDGATARQRLRHRFFSKRNSLLRINAEDTVSATFRRVTESVRVNQPALQQILAGATAYLLGLFYSAQQAQPAAEMQNPNVIERAIARVQNDFACNLDMERLAQELGVGYRWFRRAFVAHTGLSPHQYLLELRLVRARVLLGETNLSVKEIAFQTGFEDENYFSRLFRKKLNHTPSEWCYRFRRRGQNASCRSNEPAKKST